MVRGTVRIPDLAHDIGVSIPIHVEHDRIVKARIVRMNHNRRELDVRFVGAHRDDAPFFRPRGFIGNSPLAVMYVSGSSCSPAKISRRPSRSKSATASEW